MDKMKLETEDLALKNLKKIAELFPNCLTEAKDHAGGGKTSH